MFQTEPILYLQSFASEALTAFLSAVTWTGFAPFYVAFLSLLMFGVNFRKGFLLLQVVLWTALLTDLLKNLLGMPRPSDVDSAVQLLGKSYPNPTSFHGAGADSFFGLPDSEAIQFYRAQPDWSYGIPSGHTSVTTAMWAVIALLYPNRRLRVLGVVIVVLMPLSRMYLGRHFVGDVLAGLALGVILAAIAWAGFVRPRARRRLLDATRLRLATDLRALIGWAALLGVPLIAPLLTRLVSPTDGGRLFGVNLAFLLIGLRGFPSDAVALPRRLLRVLLAPALYVLVGWLVGLAVGWGVLNAKGVITQWLAGALPTLALLWGTVWIGLRTGLYDGRLEDPGGRFDPSGD